jgi:transposase
MMQPLNSELFPPVPTDTAKAAWLVLREGNFYLVVGDQANSLFSGLILDDSMEWTQKPAHTLAMLYLITIFQFVESLPDPLAADALQMRVDWKYALHLPLNYPGLDVSLFCEFRQWLLKDHIRMRNMQLLFSRLSRVNESPVKQRLRQKNVAIIVDVCLFSRLAKVCEAIREALEVMATKQPEMLRGISLSYWFIRYNTYCQNLNLRVERGDLVALAQVIGADGLHLLKAISKAESPEMADLPEALALQQAWQDQYEWVAGKLSWRKGSCAHCYLASKK